MWSSPSLSAMWIRGFWNSCPEFRYPERASICCSFHRQPWTRPITLFTDKTTFYTLLKHDFSEVVQPMWSPTSPSAMRTSIFGINDLNVTSHNELVVSADTFEFGPAFCITWKGNNSFFAVLLEHKLCELVRPMWGSPPQSVMRTRILWELVTWLLVPRKSFD